MPNANVSNKDYQNKMTHTKIIKEIDHITEKQELFGLKNCNF